MLVASGRFKLHRSFGLAVLIAAPLVTATSAWLGVLSAARALASGQPDALIVQNVMVTLQFALLVCLGFLLRRQRALHGALLASTAILFGGIALFFALLTFVPMLRIEGPETFYRFGLAAMIGQAICLAVGAALFASAPRTRWPYLLAAVFFVFSEGLNQALTGLDLAWPATRMVGSLDAFATFTVVFAAMGAGLAAVLRPRLRLAGGPERPRREQAR
ncbi:MAG: hypothetical protein V2I27_02280 [Erythrobacter sp.]|jgi:hypothetical protein|nr:hypothetical protein [Erythrobacter sp.]